MNRNRSLTIAAIALVAVAMIAAAGCKTSGMAVTSRGQVMKINISHPNDLPEAGEDNFTVDVANRGVNAIKNVLIDVEVPAQLVVTNEDRGRGINVMHDPGSNVYHYSLDNLNVGDNAKITYRVRTSFGTMTSTDSIKVTAWQRDLPGDKLVETAVIKLRR